MLQPQTKNRLQTPPPKTSRAKCGFLLNFIISEGGQHCIFKYFRLTLLGNFQNLKDPLSPSLWPQKIILNIPQHNKKQLLKYNFAFWNTSFVYMWIHSEEIIMFVLTPVNLRQLSLKQWCSVSNTQGNKSQSSFLQLHEDWSTNEKKKKIFPLEFNGG